MQSISFTVCCQMFLLEMGKAIIILLTLGLLQMKWSALAEEVTIFPLYPVLKIPSITTTLWPGVPLVCGLEPSSLVPQENYTTRWITPGGEIFNSTRDRFFLSEVESRFFVTRNVTPATIFTVTQVTYQDAGVYTCEGRNNASGDTSPWASATTELQLCLELLSNDTIIVATTDDTSTEMSCEMGAYIRPDSSLIWEGPGGQRIFGGTNKHQIIFTNGSPDAAVNGGFVLVTSRLSILTISNPEPSDNGTYTCSVVDTDQAITIELVVLNSAGTTNSTNTTSSISRLDIIVGSVTAVLGLLTIAAIAAIALCFLRCVHNRRKEHSNNCYPMYQHSLQISGNSVDHTVVTSGITVDCTERNNTYSVGIEAVEENKAYGVVADDMEAMEENKTYGVVTDGIEAMEDNKAYGVVTDGIEALEENKAYGVVTDGIEALEENEAYGVVTDGIEAMEENKAYGVFTGGIDTL